VGLVAWHVFKEGVRDRVLAALGGFAVMLVGLAILIGQITAGQDIRIIKDVGLAAIELSGALMAVLIGVGLVSREIERRTIYSLLAKPLARWEFVVGKYLGLVLTLAANLAVMAAAFLVILAVLGATTSSGFVAQASGVRVADPQLLVAIALMLAELSLLTAIALFFSTFSSSAWLSTIFTGGIYIVGLFNGDLRRFAEVVPSAVVANAARVLAAVLPAFSAFDVKAQVVQGDHLSLGFVAMTMLYGVLYAATAVGAAIALFSRREFK
jgi:ABC-type transport system involved in multi-copper enzyme maturation permease subunit